MNPIRRVAALATLSLVAAGLGVSAAQPASAADAQVLSWGVSQYLDEHLTGQSFTDGATESADGVVTFTGGVTTGDTTKYQGVAKYSFSGLYSFAFSDLALTVDDDGDGSIGADVAWTAPGDSGVIADAVLATFSTDDDWSDGSLTGTPDWAGVAPADSYGAGKPVDGASWAVDFVEALPTSVSPTFYASGSNPTSDAQKSPAAFTATAPADDPEPATKTVATAVSYGSDGVTFAVDGSGGFTGTDGNPGDAGVYVGLAPAGGLPDVSTQDAMAGFAAAAFVPTAAVQGGGFSTTLTAPANALERGTSYSLYTWRAHGHSTTSQDTETPVTIGWAKITSSVKASIAKKPTTKKAGKLAVAVTGRNGTAAGKVTVKLAKVAKPIVAKLKAGRATVQLPKLKKGTWRATVSYAGSTGYLASPAKKLTVEVKKG